MPAAALAPALPPMPTQSGVPAVAAGDDSIVDASAAAPTGAIAMEPTAQMDVKLPVAALAPSVPPPAD